VLFSFYDTQATGASVDVKSIDVACFVATSLRKQLARNPRYLDGPVSLAWEGCVVDIVSVSEAGASEPHFAITVRLADEAEAEAEAEAAVAGIAPAAARVPLGGSAETSTRPFERLRALGPGARFTHTVRVVLPDWHGKGHSSSCNATFGSLFMHGAGIRPEWAEHVNRALSQAAPAARNMGPQQFLVYYRHLIAVHNASLDAAMPARTVSRILSANAMVLKAEAEVEKVRGASLRLSSAELMRRLQSHKEQLASSSRTYKAAEKLSRAEKKATARVAKANVSRALLETVLQ
jgi:hypothetical protein